MPVGLEIALAVVLIIAASVWIGGYVAVVVVSMVSAKVLDGEARVRFFRSFGGAYFKVSVPALLVAYAIGWAFLARLPWSSELTRMAVASALLLVILVVGIVQARGLTRLRERFATEPTDAALGQKIRRRARAAAILRGLIGLLTLGLAVHAAVLLSELV